MQRSNKLKMAIYRPTYQILLKSVYRKFISVLFISTKKRAYFDNIVKSLIFQFFLSNFHYTSFKAALPSHELYQE